MHDQMKKILETMIKGNEISNRFYDSLSSLEPTERFKAELKVHKNELFVKELAQLNWSDIDSSFKRMNNYFDDFVKGFLQSNKIAKELENRIQYKKPSTQKTFVKLGNDLKVSDAKYAKHISLFSAEFFLIYNSFINILQKLLLTDNEIGLFSQHITGILLIDKNYEKVKKIQNLDICTLAELVLVDEKYYNSGLSFNMDNFHLIRQTRNMFSHHDITTCILSFQIQSLKAFMNVLLKIKEELFAFKPFDMIPNSFEDTQRSNQEQNNFLLKIANGNQGRLMRP